MEPLNFCQFEWHQWMTDFIYLLHIYLDCFCFILRIYFCICCSYLIYRIMTNVRQRLRSNKSDHFKGKFRTPSNLLKTTWWTFILNRLANFLLIKNLILLLINCALCDKTINFIIFSSKEKPDFTLICL